LRYFLGALLGLIGLTTAEGESKIVVDLETQKLFALEGGKVVLQFPCSTGRKGLETPTGVVRIQKKKRHARALPALGGGEIPFALQIYMYDPKQGKTRRINIHGYKDVPNYPASSGCIRLRIPDAEKLFNWAEVDWLVEIVDRYAPPKAAKQEEPARLGLVIERQGMVATLYGDSQGEWEPIRQMPLKHFVDEALVSEAPNELPADWPYGEFVIHSLKSSPLAISLEGESRSIEIRRAIPGKKNHSWWLRITFSDLEPTERHSSEIRLGYDQWPHCQHLRKGDKVLIKR